MTALELALGFVFIGNAVFMVVAGLLLYRILLHTRTAHEALLAAAGETRNAGKQLQTLAHASHDKLSRLASGPVGPADGAQATQEAAAIDRLTRLVNDLVARQARSSGDGPQAAGGEDGKALDDRPQRSELERALAQNHRLRKSLDQLRLQLDEAQKTITDLRQDQRSTTHEALQNMRQMVERLHTQLDAARKHARDADKRANAMEVELLKVRDAIQHSESRAELGDLEQRLNQMQSENQSLSGEVNELKELIQRTLREKHFIEDRYLQLDGRQDETAPQAALAAALQ